jgi:hypothetical protein
VVALLNGLSGSSVENRLGLELRVSGGWSSGMGGEHKEREKEGEHGGSTVNSCMKMEQ